MGREWQVLGACNSFELKNKYWLALAGRILQKEHNLPKLKQASISYLATKPPFCHNRLIFSMSERESQLPQDEDDTKRAARKKLEQGARNLVISGHWAYKHIDNPFKQIQDMDAARELVDNAAEELGENPYQRGTYDWNKWNSDHYIQPVQDNLEKERKRK